MRCKLNQLIIYILMVYCYLNTTNISTSNNCSICEQWGGIISKLILFYIQYTMKLAWIWLPYSSTINSCRWPAVFLYIKGSKTLINQYKFKSFEVQLFLDIAKYQLPGIFLLIYCVFIYSSLNIKIKTIASPVTLIHSIFITYSCFPATILYFYILSRCISIFITYSLLILNPNLFIFYIFKRL